MVELTAVIVVACFVSALLALIADIWQRWEDRRSAKRTRRTENGDR